jgi:hypothetical protein
VGGYVTSIDLIMHDLASDKYYKMIFSNWQSGGNGGAVTYDRILIPENQVITFSDGSVKRIAGEPTYLLVDSTPYNIPEPGIYYLDNDGGGGTFYIPNPINLVGQKIIIIYTANNTIYFGEYPIYNITGGVISTLSAAGTYEFTSINNQWLLTSQFLV